MWRRPFSQEGNGGINFAAKYFNNKFTCSYLRDVDFLLFKRQGIGPGPRRQGCFPQALPTAIYNRNMQGKAESYKFKIIESRTAPPRRKKKILRINSTSPGQKRQQGHYISPNSYLPGSLHVFVYVQKELKEEGCFLLEKRN